MEEYKIKDVIEILGINKSRVQYYYDTGVIVPLRDSKGPGTNRYFSRRNIAEILLAMTLTKLGVGIRINAIIVNVLRNIEREKSEELRKNGEIQPHEVLSCIEPGGVDYGSIIYLSIAFSFEDEQHPTVNIHIFNDGKDTHQIDIPFDKSSYILWVNLTEIKLVLEEKLKIDY
ncbi:MerR family transcriptional regulator [Desulfocastanea catecholica]